MRKEVLSLALQDINFLSVSKYDYHIEGTLICELKCHRRCDYKICYILVLPDERIVCGCGTNLIIWDLNTKSNIVLESRHSIIKLLSDGRILTYNEGSCIEIWDLSKKTPERTINLNNYSIPLLILPNNGIVVNKGNNIEIWNPDTGHKSMDLIGHTHRLTCFEYMNEYLVSGSYDTTIKIWNLVTTKCEATLQGHIEAIISIAIFNNKIISTAYDGTLRIWNENVCEKVIHTQTINTILIAGDKFITTSRLSETIRVWNSTGKCKYILKGHKGKISAMALLPNNQLMSAALDGTLRIWNVDTGREVHKWNTRWAGTSCVAICGGKVITDFKNTIKVWE